MTKRGTYSREHKNSKLNLNTSLPVNSWIKDIKENKNKIILTVLFLIIAIILNNIAGKYTTSKAIVKEVPDLLLDRIPVINLALIFVYGYFLINAIFLLYPLIRRPSKIHYYLGQFSLFIVIRAFFTVLTHLKTPADAIVIKFPWIFEKMLFANDLFFSGHVGLPFLGFLILRKDNKLLSKVMLALSLIMTATVLLMHQHYSIDVFAAFFIAYGIYKIGNKLFNGRDSL